mgnify:FL=1|jgi:hypothetical protein|tara:strand:- start:317 stop:424 length:108 start_codon:yes stop_codon:yes gene_type:complete
MKRTPQELVEFEEKLKRLAEEEEEKAKQEQENNDE